MVDATLYTATGKNEPIISGPMANEHFQTHLLDGTAYVADIMAQQATASPDIDAIADNEAGTEIGLIVRPLVRPSDTWDADTILADNTWVIILMFGTMLYVVYMLINGQDTPVVGETGNFVYSTSTDGSTNDSRDGSGTLNATQGFTAVVGRLNAPHTTGNSTSAVNGTYGEVRV